MNRVYHVDGTRPENNRVFVFGSNQSGIHGAGAAKVALDYGAVFNVGFGRRGSSYAVPTKDYKVDTLPIEIIQQYVQAFIDHTLAHQDEYFFVTRVGCGLEIAPLFKRAINCSFATSWKQYLES
jgi:hypothetical protein